LAFVYATNRPWAIEAFLNQRTTLSGDWILITTPSDLEALLIHTDPEYIFFPHWSHIVPTNIVENYRCVCFHMTDLPFGKGGSPLQNLIVRGIKKTKLTSLKMIAELDAGPIYKQDDLKLLGSAHEIFKEMSKIIIKQMKFIVSKNPTPHPQKNLKLDTFQRRKNADSKIQEIISLDQIYDHIRMLDAPTYPHAYIESGAVRYEFTDVKKSPNGNSLTSKVKITIIEKSRKPDK